MCEDGILGGCSQRGRQSRIDARDDFGGRTAAVIERSEDLTLSHLPVLEVIVDHGCRILDGRTVSGEQSRGPEVSHPMKRVQVLAEVAPPACRNHHRPADPHEIAAVQISGGLIEKAEVIRGVPGGMDGPKTMSASLEELTVAEWVTHPSPADDQPRPVSGQLRGPGGVVHVTMCDQNKIERCSCERTLDRRDMIGIADARVDQRRRRGREKVGVIAARSGPLRRVVRGQAGGVRA
jgi:hypothetical protein